MTNIRSYYVCENAHYEYSKKLGLNEFVLLGNGEEETGGRDRKAIIADIYEAFIGAIFLDQGFEYVKSFENKNDLLKFRNFGKKSLTELDELLESMNLSFGMDVSKYKLDKE